MKIFTILFFTLLIFGCSDGGSDDDDDNTSGTITLSGPDTAIIGTQLDTGVIGSSLAAGSQPDHIVIVNSGNTVTFTAPNLLTPDISDIDNGLVLVVTNALSISGFQGISMGISVNGIRNDYACTTPVTTFIDCGSGSISLDIGNKTVTFDNLVVINVVSGTILAMNGTLTWQ